MYKPATVFTLEFMGGKLSKHTQAFKTRQEFEEWENYQLMNGWKIIDEYDFKEDLKDYIIEKFGQEYFNQNYL